MNENRGISQNDQRTYKIDEDARKKLALPNSYTVTNLDKSCTNLFGDRGKKKIYVEGKKSFAI
jgi:hypothetical protein